MVLKESPWRSSGVRKEMKRITGKALGASGLSNAWLKYRSKKGAAILAYHRVNTRSYILSNRVMGGMYVSVESLECQLAWLKDNFQVVRVSEIISRLKKGGSWDRPLCAITFDDGWYDTYEMAFPILRNLQVPSTVFIVGSRVGTCEPDCFHLCYEVVDSGCDVPKNLTGIKKIDVLFRVKVLDPGEKARRVINEVRTLGKEEFDQVHERVRTYYYNSLDGAERNRKYRALSWEDMRVMQRHDVEIGYHSKNHYMLTKRPVEELHGELVLPARVAASYGVRFSRIFCYPDGQYNDNIIRTLKELGYSGAASLARGFNHVDTNPYILRRINVHEGATASLNDFILLIAKA